MFVSIPASGTFLLCFVFLATLYRKNSSVNTLGHSLLLLLLETVVLPTLTTVLPRPNLGHSAALMTRNICNCLWHLLAVDMGSFGVWLLHTFRSYSAISHPKRLVLAWVSHLSPKWHQLGHMHVCTLLQPDNHASTPPLRVFFTDRVPFLPPNQHNQSTEGSSWVKIRNTLFWFYNLYV